ncbi:MAG: CBS domain-containing protein [Bacteroidota bacterium]
MTAYQLINYIIPSLKKSDDISRAKQWMDELRVKELPVIHEDKLLGFITEDLLFDTEIITPTVVDYPLIGQTCFVKATNHYYDVLKVQSDHQMKMAAVLDLNDNFQGVVLTDDILHELAKTAIVNSIGAIVVLKSTLSDYSLHEISRLVEMNDSTILGVNVKPDPDDPALLEITLRINHQNVNQIASGLTKSGYQVTSSYNTEDNSFDEKDRFSLLMKFLDP